jgi:hypothetical protein
MIFANPHFSFLSYWSVKIQINRSSTFIDKLFRNDSSEKDGWNLAQGCKREILRPEISMSIFSYSLLKSTQKNITFTILFIRKNC